MKTTIKRFLLILPVMFCMVLGLAVPAVSSAYVDSDFYSYSDLYSDFSNSSDYIVFKFESIQNYGTSLWTCGVFLSGFDYSVSSSGSVYTISVPHNSSSILPFYYMYRNFGDTRTPRTEGDIHSFTFNIDTSELHFYSSSGEEIESFVPSSSNSLFDCQYDLEGVSAGLNVSVEFQPDLSGSVDRTITNGSGASGLSQGFNMTVSNNGRVPCQYRMAIFEGTSILAYPSGGIYSDTDNCIYAYLTKQWVMAADISTMRHIYAYETATKQFTSCNWHYLAAGTTDEQFFKFSQINFKPNVEYTVIVEVVPNSGGMTSIYFTGNTLARGDGEHAMDSSFEQYILSNDDIEVVHRSTFTIPNLSDVTYNPDDSSNGLIPNSSHEDYARAINTRDAYEKEDGTIDYSSYNAYDDPNSWINDPKIKSSEEWYALGNTFYDDGVTSLSYSGSSFGSGFVPASVGSLGTGVANFGLFLTSVFGLLPPAFSSLLTIGLITIVIIGIIKAVK